jgi:hypothetical protein
MKTIFFTIFEGVEAKNILRTGIIAKVLQSDPDVRAVLFMKNKERVEYYKNEFNNPRIIYEVVGDYLPNRADKFFSKSKFNFLQTETTDLRAKMVAEERGIFYYYYSLIIHRILAHSYFVKFLRFLDYKIVKCDLFDKYFDKYKPDLVFLANLFEDLEVNFLRSAQKHGVFSIGLINSWDRVTARCILRLLPNRLIVFNEIVKKEIIETNYFKPANIFVSGLPQYDAYFEKPTISREEFFRKLDIDPEKKILVYSPIGGMFSNSDWDMMDLIYRLNTEKKFGDNVVILVRFPPNDFIKEEDLKDRPYLIYQYPGTRFSSTRSTDWDMNSAELDELRNTLQYMSLIVCYASSISIDAVVFNKPVININYEIKDNIRLSKSPTVFYKMIHYKKALNAGGIKLVDNENELVEWIKKYLRDPSLDSEGRKRLVEKQCQYTDGKSAERISNFVTSFM